MRISRILFREQATSVNLTNLVSSQQVIIVPFGGGISPGWEDRFAPLACPEFHLYDREFEPQTSLRQQMVRLVSSRRSCSARITTKRSLDNYLHPAAIAAAGGGELEFGDDDCVPQLLARSRLLKSFGAANWDELSLRTRQRLLYRAKKWLNTRAADQMTTSLLAERDPRGEILEWLATIAKLTEV